jgi:hypothetical protein
VTPRYRIEDCSDEDGPDWRVFEDPYGEIGIFSSRATARKFVADRRGDDRLIRWIDEGRWT